MLARRAAGILWIAASLAVSAASATESPAVIADARALATQALEKLNGGDIASAVKLVERAQKKAAADPEVLIATAQVDVRAGRTSAAVWAAERAAALAPGRFDAHAMLCGLHVRDAERERLIETDTQTKDEFAKAVPACANAILTSDGSPRRVVLYDLQARALVGVGSTDAAAAAYRSWISVAPNDGRAYGGLAVLQADEGHAEDAAATLGDARARSPEAGRTARYEFILGRFHSRPPDLLPMIDALLEEETVPSRQVALSALSDTLRGLYPSTLDALFETALSRKLPPEDLTILWRKLVPGAGPGFPAAGVVPQPSWEVALPRLTHSVSPVYPTVLRRELVDGWVIVAARIEVDGLVHDVVVVEASDPRFIGPSVDAVRRRRYEPGRQGKQPVPVIFTTRVRFDVS